MEQFGKLGRWWLRLMTFSLQPEHVSSRVLYRFVNLFPSFCACIEVARLVSDLITLYYEMTSRDSTCLTIAHHYVTNIIINKTLT